MRAGLVIGLHGSTEDAPRWTDVLAQAVAAEEAGFDLVVLEDALLYRDERKTIGYWEAIAMAAALGAATSRIEIGHSVINAPYRPAAFTAKIAETIDEITGGRYVLGIGLGNTPYDYEPFGIPADRRYARFAEALPIIADLLRTGRVSFDGEFHRARDAELVLRGPRPQGPPIVVAARGPKMLELAARHADGWNWWTVSGTERSELEDVVRGFEEACQAVGRSTHDLARSLDVYSVLPPGGDDPRPDDGGVLRGSSAEIAESLLGFAELGFDEVRLDLAWAGPVSAKSNGVRALSDVVRLVHAG
ncbi:MAG TPA: LLM class flavin-dependent oxidoreductase [Candidatus Limnocylindria bacterium]|nr:LLM class flavin-dependent oxidoreductase [Candidatus Limnocylindria bacterium]